jgi:putative Mg2+ transporter-C (MgtC) family protein
MNGFDQIAADLPSVILKILLAALMGGALGFERTRKMRGAGLRTYMLVCLGAAMAMMTGEFVANITGDSDSARIPAQVINGICIIGAGTIMVTGYFHIKGITTAAGLLLCASLGLAIGTGFYAGAVAMLIITIFVMLLGEKIEKEYLSKGCRMRIFVLLGNADNLSVFLNFLKSNCIYVSEFEQITTIGGGVSATFMLKLRPKQNHSEALETLSACPGVNYLEEV